MLALKLMRESLELLASSSADQVNYLKKLGTYPSTDELALEFDAAIFAFYSEVEENGVSVIFNDVTGLEKLKVINSILDKMSTEMPESFWIVDYLDDENWSKIRKLSDEVLNMMKR